MVRLINYRGDHESDFNENDFKRKYLEMKFFQCSDVRIFCCPPPQASANTEKMWPSCATTPWRFSTSRVSAISGSGRSETAPRAVESSLFQPSCWSFLEMFSFFFQLSR